MNFMITQVGLEEQLLGMVVEKERADLGEAKAQIIEDNNGFNIKLKQLEDDLLFSLSNSQGDILDDIALIEGLEESKRTSTEIKRKQALAAVTEQEIALAMEGYRPVAIRGALVYFLVDQLWVLSHMYRFAMSNFVAMFKKGMGVSDVYEEGEEGAPEPQVEGEEAVAITPAMLKIRIERLIDKSCYTVFAFVSQGLFERHKLIFGSQLCFRVLAKRGELDTKMFEFLIRCPRMADLDLGENLKDWLDVGSWQAICALKEITEPISFASLPSDMDQQAKRFKEWFELERPEDAGMPGEWKKLPEFPKLLIMRCLRTDRMGEALAMFVKKELGAKYVTSMSFDLKRSFADASAQTPVFFILTPGFDPVVDTELIGKDYDISIEAGTLGLVSLGQGQEPVAEKIVERAAKNGEWGFLQNIHLTAGWTEDYLEKRCEALDTAHVGFRLFLSGEPGGNPPLPINLLMICLKLNNEPPEGLKPNLLKAMLPFDDQFYESCSKVAELRSITFMISFFHAIILERKKFGPQGWNVMYAFNLGDLTGSGLVAVNYLEANTKIPWADLRYITGEILYGGHITNNFDRRLVDAYLNTYLNPDLLDGVTIFPGFVTPSNSMNCKQYREYIEETMPPESPVAYGMHPNAEIGFRFMQAEQMFQSIVELMPRSGGGEGGMTLQEKAKAALDEVLEKLPDQFVLVDILDRVEERTPYVNVFLQEIELMIILTGLMRKSLLELDQGLRGDLQITDAMDQLMASLADNKVPSKWAAAAFPSSRPFASWLTNVLSRQKQLDLWTGELGLPKCTWICGLFMPQSFLTAVMQTTARRNEWPLDKTVNQTEVTRWTQPEQVTALNKEGAYVNGFVMEGARWDEKTGGIEESRPKELFAPMPVCLIKAVTVDKVETGVYPCPVFKTQIRGAGGGKDTFVYLAGIKTKHKPIKWILAGVAIIMDVVM